MFLVNGQKAILRKYNRTETDSIYDDEDYIEETIKCCPYGVEQAIRFGINTIPEAKGFFILPRHVDVREGDQVIYLGRGRTFKQKDILTILEVRDNWLFNRVENYIVIVK